MNRWHVYEWLKSRYYEEQKIPSIRRLMSVFKDLDSREILEGVYEFEEVFGVTVEREKDRRVEHAG